MEKKEVLIYEENNRTIYKGNGNIDGDKLLNLRDLVTSSKTKYGERIAFKFKRNRKIVEKSYLDFASDIDCMGTALCTLGLKGKKIAIISENRYEWAVSYLAIANGTGVVVPLDKHLPESEIENLLLRSKCEAIFFSKQYKEIMKSISLKNNFVKKYICMDDIPMDKEKKFVTMDYLAGKGTKELIKGNRCFTNAKIENESMNFLIFTSGTTKASKGVMLSHKNIISGINSCAAIIKLNKDDIHLSLLPLHHTFENTIGFLYMVYSGVCIAYCEGIKHLAENLQEFGVSILIAVPAIYEALYKRFNEGIKKSGKENAVKTLEKLATFCDKLGFNARRKIMSPIRNRISPKLRFMVSGAAPMKEDIIETFENIGIRFVQGYGLTETAPIVCATNPEKRMVGGVGYPVKDVSVTLDNIDENGIGELLVKGGNVTLGYFENEEETKEVFTEDGWFRTGDLAQISKDGEVKIVGRAKSMIVFPNGKKAFPEEYESILNLENFIKESFVWGYKTKDGDVQICAKIVVDGKDENVASKVEEVIKEINKNVPQYKIIRYFILTNEELIKTTTLKIKRPIEQKNTEEYISSTGKDMRKLNKSFIHKV